MNTTRSDGGRASDVAAVPSPGVPAAATLEVSAAPARSVPPHAPPIASITTSRGMDAERVHGRPISERRPPTPDNSVMLVARDLAKEYVSGGRPLAVLHDVSFEIPQGAFVA